MSRVNLDHGHTACFSFVGQEAVKLSKRPRVDTALALDILSVLASSDLGGLSNVGQVFQNEGRSGGCILHNAFAEDVIVVSSLPKQFARKLLQVPFSRFCSFSLEFTSDTEHASLLLFPSTVTQEMAIGGHGGPIKPKINPNHGVRGFDRGSWKGNDNMQEVTPVVEAQISRTDLATNVLERVLGDRKGHLNATRYSCEGAGHGLPFHPVRTSVVTNGGGYRLWTTDRLELRRWASLLFSFCHQLRIACLVFLLPRESAFHGLGSFHTRGTHELSRKIRMFCTQGIIGCFVQLYTVAASRLEPLTANGIETFRMLLHRSIQDSHLLFGRIQLYHNCSVHTRTLSYIQTFVNREEYSVCGQLSFLPRIHDGGLQKGTR